MEPIKLTEEQIKELDSIENDKKALEATLEFFLKNHREEMAKLRAKAILWWKELRSLYPSMDENVSYKTKHVDGNVYVVVDENQGE